MKIRDGFRFGIGFFVAQIVMALCILPPLWLMFVLFLNVGLQTP